MTAVDGFKIPDMHLVGSVGLNVTWMGVLPPPCWTSLLTDGPVSGDNWDPRVVKFGSCQRRSFSCAAACLLTRILSRILEAEAITWNVPRDAR